MSFEQARQIADAVLLDGNGPPVHRAPPTLGRGRWPFGVLAPRGWSEGAGGERWWLQTECLVESSPHLRLDARLRFLHDAELRELDYGGIAVTEHMELELPFAIAEPEGTDTIAVRRGGQTIRRIVRRHRPLQGVLRIGAQPIDVPHALVRLRLRVENTTPWPDTDAPREEVLPACLLATHLLLGISDGAFVSLLDPPAWAADAAEHSRCVGSYPVLVGTLGRRDLVLASPVVLHDYPNTTLVTSTPMRSNRYERAHLGSRSG